MADHTRALVPIETWCFNAPELRSRGIAVDIGQLAEALIYYEQVLLNVADPHQFAAVLNWFVVQEKFNDFIAMLKDGTLQLYEYSFVSAPIYSPEHDTYMLMNVQDKIQLLPNSFEKRYLYHDAVSKVVSRSRHREVLYKAVRDHVIEVKADEFSEAIEEAKRDFCDGRRNALTVQSFIDELYKFKHLGRPPEIKAEIIEHTQDKHTAAVNIDYKNITEVAGPELNWDKGTPLAGTATANRFLLSASKLGCDLFLGQPISILVGDKLYESTTAVVKSAATLDSLKFEVEFPDVRKEVAAQI